MVIEGIGTVVVTHHRTATTSRFRDVEKAVENLYYLLLLSSPAYAEKSGRFRRWANIGFGQTVREPPRDALRPDRVLLDIDPADAPRIPISLRQGNPQTARQLATLFRDIDKVRSEEANQSQTEEQRTKAVLSSPPVQATLIEPLERALRDDHLTEAEIERYMRVVSYSVAILTEDNVSSLQANTVADRGTS